MKAAIFFFVLISFVRSLGAPIIINEAFPAPTAPEPEWIEIFNRSEMSVELSNYLIGDAKTLKPLPSLSLPACGYALITKDTNALKAARSIPAGAALIQIALPSLNNDADSIRLANALDSMVEDLFLYKSSWGKKGKSYERVSAELPAISPGAVAPSEDESGATPGRKNSCDKPQRKVPAPGSLLVNEIMYDADCEFIELYNASADTLNLLDWSLCDAGSASPVPIDALIPPDSLAVCAWDSAFFLSNPELAGSERVIINSKKISLNNSGDKVIIRDFTGATQDSLDYSPEWHTAKGSTKGISLEKRGERLPSALKSSWGSSDVGATPLAVNSLMLSIPEGAFSAEPRTFSAENPTKISFNLPEGVWSVRITLYDVSGRFISEVFCRSGHSGKESFRWSGLETGGARLARGGYLLLLEAVDERTGRRIDEKTLIAIG